MMLLWGGLLQHWDYSVNHTITVKITPVKAKLGNENRDWVGNIVLRTCSPPLSLFSDVISHGIKNSVLDALVFYSRVKLLL